MSDESIRIEMVENGIVVHCSWNEGEGAKKEYKDETYVFPDMDTAMEHMKGKFPKNKKVQKELKGLIGDVIG